MTLFPIDLSIIYPYKFNHSFISQYDKYKEWCIRHAEIDDGVK